MGFIQFFTVGAFKVLGRYEASFNQVFEAVCKVSENLLNCFVHPVYVFLDIVLQLCFVNMLVALFSR